MSRFIPLSIFKELYAEQSNLLSNDGLQDFIRTLQENQGKSIALANGISEEELNTFIHSLQDPQAVIFYGWIEQNPVLNDFLLTGQLKSGFEDLKHHLRHEWAEAYRRFISPILSERILGVRTETMPELSKLFSYVLLLDNDHRTVVEAQLFKGIKIRLTELQDAGVMETEQELIELIKPLCEDEVIASVNCLSKASYANKLDYVDTVLSAIRSNGCTVRLANWILKQMSRIELNNEHVYKLEDLRADLKEGRLEVRNHGKGRMPIRWRPIVFFVFLLLAIGAIVSIIIFKPFSSVEEDDFQNGASFKEFNKEERKHIDSLLKEMNDDGIMDLNETDPGLITQTSDIISMRKDFKVDLMERIYSDINRDATLKENYAMDSCANPVPFKRYPGVKDLSSKSGVVEARMRNESDYDVIIYVCENRSSGNVYSLYLRKNATTIFNMNHGDIITTVAGNQFSTFKLPDIDDENEAPSIAFKYHFCDTDANYFESLNAPIQLMRDKNGQAKFMVMGDRNGYYRLIDSYSVSDPY